MFCLFFRPSTSEMSDSPVKNTELSSTNDMGTGMSIQGPEELDNAFANGSGTPSERPSTPHGTLLPPFLGDAGE